MRKRFWLMGGIVLLAIIAITIWRGIPQRNSPRAPGTAKNSPASEINQTRESRPSEQTAKVEPSNDIVPQDQPQQEPVLEKRTQQIETWLREKNRPIDFWGKVVDQDDNPVAGARIKATVRQWSLQTLGNVGAGGKQIDTESSTDGLFVISNQRGDVLSIAGIKKDGYELSPQAPHAFNYARGATANPESPVVFKMWKHEASAQLVTQDKDTRIPYDGTPVTFDLLTGEQTIGKNVPGDVRVTLIRNPLHIEPRQKFDWTATVEALNGGVIETTDEFMYRAPDSGYEPAVEIKVSSSAEGWTPQKKLQFYVKSRRGQLYGRMVLTFRTGSDRDTTGFTIASSVNPEGSRNLQP